MARAPVSKRAAPRVFSIRAEPPSSDFTRFSGLFCKSPSAL